MISVLDFFKLNYRASQNVFYSGTIFDFMFQEFDTG
jgi:hypothetical protein